MIEAAAMCNFNMYPYYIKWLRDITHTPHGDGEGNPDWHGDYIMLAYRIWHFYGDFKPLGDLYPKAKADVCSWIKHSDSGILKNGFGDWCLPNNNTWEQIGECKMAVNTSLLYAYCRILSEAASLLGKSVDEELFNGFIEKIRGEFYLRYCHEDGSVNTGRQTEMILPIYVGLLEGERLERAKTALLRRISADGHLDTGGFGTMALVSAAAASGGVDILPVILNTGSYPGFGFWLANGATSLWEQWAVKGVMHSHSHGMFAGIDASFYSVICGITPLSPGFGSFSVSPCIPADMSYAECSMQTAAGRIALKAERLYGGLELTVVTPPNTTATLEFPNWDKYSKCGMWEGERRIEKRRVLTLGGGVYNFRLVPEKNLNGVH